MRMFEMTERITRLTPKMCGDEKLKVNGNDLAATGSLPDFMHGTPIAPPSISHLASDSPTSIAESLLCY